MAPRSSLRLNSLICRYLVNPLVQCPKNNGSSGNGVGHWIGRRVRGRKNTTRLPTLNPEEPVILFNFVKWYFQEGISEGGPALPRTRSGYMVEGGYLRLA
jgi:hypothetical protein